MWNKRKEKTRKKIKQYVRGSISIMMSFILTGVLSLSALVVESIRYKAAVTQLEESSIMSALSLLAGYDTDLEKRFGLYGVNSESTSDTAFLNYLMFNSDNTDTGVYAASELDKLYGVTKGEAGLQFDLANYLVLKRQILEYEKYRAPIDLTEDLLDIDKKLKDLKELMWEKIPALESFMNICNYITAIMEALEEMYCLYRDVQQLQLLIGLGDDANTLEKLSNIFGQGWEKVEGLFTDEEWPEHDPSYLDLYSTFESAVNTKVEYMKNNSQPPDPGPKPTADVEALYATYENAMLYYEELAGVYAMLSSAYGFGYCDENGIVNPSAEIEEFKDFTKDELAEYSLTKKTTRSSFLSIMNSNVASIAGSFYVVDTFTNSTLEQLLLDLETLSNEAYFDMSEAQSQYTTANGRLEEWNEKNNALIAYNQKLEEYNSAIDSAKDAFKIRLDSTLKKLGEYKDRVSSVTKALDSTIEAVGVIAAENGAVVDEETSNAFNALKAQLGKFSADLTIAGITFLTEQQARLVSFKSDEVTASYVFSNVFNKGSLEVDGLSNGGYYMTKAEIIPFYTTITLLDLAEQLSSFMDYFDMLMELYAYISPLPYVSEIDCMVELDSTTISLLPSNIHNGDGTKETTSSTDVSELSTILADARTVLGDAYASDIDQVDPNKRAEEMEARNDLIEAMERLANNLSGLVTGPAQSLIENLTNGEGWKLIDTVFALFDMVGRLIQIFEDLIFIINNIGTVIDILLQSLSENILINQYAVTMFPNRTTDTDENFLNNEISGYLGPQRTLVPLSDPSYVNGYKTFSGAHVEYIAFGEYREEQNQLTAWYIIFAIRVLNNIIGVLADPDLMSAVSAANLLAPVVFIFMVYYESNFDMNILLSGGEVPLIKTQMRISPKTLQANGKAFMEELQKMAKEANEKAARKKNNKASNVQKIDTEKQLSILFKTEGILEEMKYQDYLWFFLLFVPNKTKVMRIADLIQMEMRYKYYMDGKGTEAASYELQNLHTYVRCEAEAKFNSVLPVISMEKDAINNRGIKLRTIKYIGY